MNMNDTIAALATARGEGGIAVIRISGPLALEAALKVFRPARAKGLKKRMLTYGRIIGEDGSVLDEAMAVYLPAPYTYTREDVCELQCHGGRTVPDMVLARVLATGLVRPAEPGEFTKRAFLSGRIDLSEAEAVMGVIRADGEAAARAAARQMEGGVSAFVNAACKKLEELLALVSAATDFPDEIDEEVTSQRVVTEAKKIREEILSRCDPRAAHAVREGVSVVLAGRPNVGKSSLMNAAAGTDRAIVSSIPGTTRDVLTERLVRNGILIELSDTAGQRETGDDIEAMGVDRARRTESGADCVLLVLDASEPLSPDDALLLSRADERYLIVINKTDAGSVLSACDIEEEYHVPVMEVSAGSGTGVGEMLDRALAVCGAGGVREDSMTVLRHISCAGRAASALERLEDTVKRGDPLDLVTDDLWQAMYALIEITGRSAAEDVISSVFENFCVGK